MNGLIAGEKLERPRVDDDPIPIVIAVTGHREIAAETVRVLDQAVAEFFRGLRRQYPATPLQLLSGLAEGADRLVAKVALENSVELLAVFPMQVEEYENDFACQESRDEFRALLSQASATVVAENSADPTGRISARDQLYARQGALLVQNCDLLLALWDGDAEHGAGGTAEVVLYQLEGVANDAKPTQNPFENQTGRVYHVLTPRRMEQSMRLTPGTVRLLYPTVSGKRPGHRLEVDQSFSAIDGFNRDLRASLRSVRHGNSALSKEVLGVAESSVPRTALQCLQSRFRLADWLAIRFQARTLRSFKAMLLCSLLSIICLQIHSSVKTVSIVYLAFYVIFLLAAYGLYAWSKRNRYESRAFDYRALAEGLRIQFFWRLAGLEESVADHYLNRQGGILKWIRRALRHWTANALNEDTRSSSAAEIELVLDLWIGDQLRYFETSAVKQKSLRTRIKQVTNLLVGLGLVLAMLKAITVTTHWTFAFATIPALVAATLLVYANTRALSEHVNQYESMRELFQAADHHLRTRLAAGDIVGCRNLLLVLGKEALAENADWLSLHRRRPVAPPRVR